MARKYDTLRLLRLELVTAEIQMCCYGYVIRSSSARHRHHADGLCRPTRKA